VTMRSSKILLSIPSISRSNFPDFDWTPADFEPTDRTLDCYKHELEGIKPKRLWGVNIPHFSLAEHGVCGVAGPGKPAEEVFYPYELEPELALVCGSYDKWRPYPAEVLNHYSIQMAEKFAKKRCKLFKYLAEKKEWETLFYVEHSPSSIAHLDEDVARDVAAGVIDAVMSVHKQWPSVPVVIFSPYGTGDKDGFIVSNLLETEVVGNWQWIREFLNG